MASNIKSKTSATTPMEPLRQPLILDIKGNSLDDGPGIRTVIFFKGCPLSCVWCHNPESKRTTVEISFDAKECIGCETCLSICTRGALSKNNLSYIDRNTCDLCFACVDACPAGALTQVGREMSVEEIAAKVLLDKPFFDTSGGGVTLSGGEPTLYMEFVSQLLSCLKERGINTLLETCGQFDFEKFMATMYPHLNTIYYDIKLLDSGAHEHYCGISNGRILDNFARIWARSKADGITLLPRIPLIPNITDTEGNIAGIARFLRGLGVSKAVLLAYNPLWHEKSIKIGAHNPFHGNQLMSSWPERKRMTHCKEILAREKIEV